MSILITELLDRADTGVSVKPFICKTEEGRKIFVKPSGVLQSSLIAEWLGGRLAEHMGLPCAEIAIVEVSDHLANANRRKEWSDFKAGLGFGSYAMGQTYRDLQGSDMAKLSEEWLANIYIFDYWVKNEDRKMGVLGGNPNTLVSYDVRAVCVIDHDNAFDPEFDLLDFKLYHIGRKYAEVWLNKKFQSQWLEQARITIDQLESYWRELPECWLDSTLDNSNAPHYNLAHYRAILERPFANPEQFWKELLQ